MNKCYTSILNFSTSSSMPNFAALFNISIPRFPVYRFQNFQISICYDIAFESYSKNGNVTDSRVSPVKVTKHRVYAFLTFFFSFQVKNRTSVSGQNANGDSPEATN